MKNLIYDIGMHTGKDTEFYLLKGFNVVSIEANPYLVEKAKLKFKKFIETGQLTIIDKAIAFKGTDEIEFYINEDKDDWGTILPDWNRGMNSNFKSIKVATVQLESIIKKYGMPYYMKIDIEGADVLCLKSLINLEDKPEFLSIELLTPDNLSNQKNECLDILSHLHVLGYNNFQISDQSKNSRVKCPNPPLEGKYLDHTFGGDSSGLFGKELKAKNYTLDTVAEMYLAYFYGKEKLKTSFIYKVLRKLKLIEKGKKNAFHAGGWFDIHASRQ